MNITKMSLVAAVLISSSAMAFDNTKVSGDANLYYQTEDGGDKNFFESGSSAADMSVNLNVSTDLIKNDSVAVSAGAGYTVLTTLGLEGTMVDGAWGGAHTATGSAADGTQNVDTVSWVNEAWAAATAGKTTVKVGRMELDTPLAFTEKWSIEKNTFEGAVVVNEDIADTTVVGGYIGRGNGASSANGTVATGAEFTNYGKQGAYVVGAMNNSWKPLNAQAWFYDLTSLAQATWIQGDLDLATLGAKGLALGAQYTTQSGTTKDTSAVAAMVGYSVEDTVSAKLSYSVVDTEGDAGANTATGNQSKLYTEAWWNYGNVTKQGAKSVNLTVEAPLAGIDLGAYITMVDHDAISGDNNDFVEYTFSASKSIGIVDASLVYIHKDNIETKITPSKTLPSSQNNTVQVYLTANF